MSNINTATDVKEILLVKRSLHSEFNVYVTDKDGRVTISQFDEDGKSVEIDIPYAELNDLICTLNHKMTELIDARHEGFQL